MTHSTVIIVAVFVIATCFFASDASVAPIWMAPKNLNYPEQVNATFDADVFENFTANLGDWATIEVATGARGSRPLSVMDSKGIIWILGGSFDQQNDFFLTAVWNFNPKTDQYRYVWKTNDSSPFVARNPGELRVQALSNHPGGIAYSTAAIDKNDNIWMYGYHYFGELWMFNTTSWMFVRQSGLDSKTSFPSLGANPGQPGEDVWPGYSEGQCAVIDSQDNIWMLAGYNNYGFVNAVWHFNTTSFLWTFITGSVTPIDATHNSTFYGGAWMNGCDIDNNDRVWIYGGWGASAASPADYGNLWTFDTRTKREWEFEYGADTFRESAVVVSNDYNSGNHPPASEGCLLIDRLDGTLMLVSGGIIVDNTRGGSDQVWQYSKSLKQWKLVYGTISSFNAPGDYTNFRGPGSAMPGYFAVGRANGKHTNGDLYLIGGTLGTGSNTAELNRKDIWLIPQDQCSNNLYKCGVNADCIDEMIGYSCKCKDGFNGDGYTCTANPVAVTPANPVAITPSQKTSGALFAGASVVGALVVALAVMNI